jgi:hypothetical protein
MNCGFRGFASGVLFLLFREDEKKAEFIEAFPFVELDVVRVESAKEALVFIVEALELAGIEQFAGVGERCVAGEVILVILG